ncbi:Chromate resistance protein ChrB [Streptomyces mirabilis]|uniref:Chromate resistance protein ChrB n=1 Tax=Streptomyces mirabilis TaxID=68239 RepID=UPI003322C688
MTARQCEGSTQGIRCARADFGAGRANTARAPLVPEHRESWGAARWRGVITHAGTKTRCREIRIGKFTLAEREEEEQSLVRLHRRHRDLTARDVFGAPEAVEAGQRLMQCTARCEDYAEQVFAALHRSEEESECPRRQAVPRPGGRCGRCTRLVSPPHSERMASPPT